MPSCKTYLLQLVVNSLECILYQVNSSQNAMTTFAGAQATDQQKEAPNLHRSLTMFSENECTVDASSSTSASLYDACTAHAISDDEAASIIEMIVDENTETNWDQVLHLATHRPADFGYSRWEPKPEWYLQRKKGNKSIGKNTWKGTLFHFVVAQRPPINVVRQILDAGTYPGYFLTSKVSGRDFRFPDHMGGCSMKKCPLALAIRAGASLEVVEFLVDVTGKEDCMKLGDIVLDHSISTEPDKTPIQILRTILQKYPQCAHAFKEGGYSGVGDSMLSAAAFQCNLVAKDLFERVDMILMATAVGTIDEVEAKEKNFLRPHALISHLFDIRKGRMRSTEISLLGFYLDRYLKSHREEFTQADTNGNLPLHVLIANNVCLGRFSEESVAFHFVLEKHLEEFPESTKVRNVDGMTPLDVAAAVGSPFYDAILEKSLDILDIQCPQSNLFPFQLAACHDDEVDGKEWSNVRHLSTNLRTEICFELLRRAPDVVDPRRLCLEDPWLDSKLVRDIYADELKLEQDTVKLQMKKQRLELLKRAAS